MNDCEINATGTMVEYKENPFVEDDMGTMIIHDSGTMVVHDQGEDDDDSSEEIDHY